jgi:myo-inositol-1(or 4)-monophosphatase
MYTPYHNEVKVAVEAARRAGDYLRNQQRSIDGHGTKTDPKDYVTSADVGSEHIILDAIKSQFPMDSVLSEESPFNESDAERLWIVDPLDGTRNYANLLRYFSVSIAFSHAQEVKVGVVYIPARADEMFYAERNQGAFLDERPLKMAAPARSLETSIVATGFSVYRGDVLHPHMRAFERVLNAAADVVRFGSAAADMCHVAAGRLGAYYESGLKAWDVAAASLIIQEAGGEVSDTKGSPLSLFCTTDLSCAIDVLAAKNLEIHQQMVRLLDSA